MSSSSAKKRVFGYDLLKALAMFMVVFYHLQMLDFLSHLTCIIYQILIKSYN